MSGKEEHRVVVMPSDDEMKVAFEAYALAVGKVAHAWNYLHEKLADVFARVIGSDHKVALGIWHSTPSDRTQEQMLKGALLEVAPDSLGADGARRKSDLIELIDKVIALGDDRNNAVHAPCMLGTNADGTRMIAHVWSNHQRAKRLKGKVLLDEFAWCEAWAESLARFTTESYSALVSADYPWPKMPTKPARVASKN